MKILLAALVAISSLSSLAGTIESRRSSDSLSFQMDLGSEEVIISGSVSGASISERVPLSRHQQEMADTEVEIQDVGLFGLPFGRIQDGMRILEEEDIRNPLLMASLVTLTLALDVAGLPFDLIDGGIKNMAINKDVRILGKAIENESYSKRVNQKRFDRIVSYLNLQ